MSISKNQKSKKRLIIKPKLIITIIGIGRMEPRKLINKKFKTAALLIFIIVLSACSSNENSKHMEKAAGTPVKTTHPVKTDLTEYSELNATTVFLTKKL